MSNGLHFDLEAGQVLRLTLARPKANIIDISMMDSMRSGLLEHQNNTDLRAVLVDAEGPNFSFGASVEEHLPDKVEAMLKAMRLLVLEMIAYPVPIYTAVTGQCLGGGLELACASSQIFSSNDARYGQPEIKLAVFAPVASVLLPERINRFHAEDLLFSGRSIDAHDAYEIGLIHSISESPTKAAMAYINKNLKTHSNFALRQAVKASRSAYVDTIKKQLIKVESQYLDELMQASDPIEGLTAFVEKRPPVYKDN